MPEYDIYSTLPDGIGSTRIVRGIVALDREDAMTRYLRWFDGDAQAPTRTGDFTALSVDGRTIEARLPRVPSREFARRGSMLLEQDRGRKAGSRR